MTTPAPSPPTPVPPAPRRVAPRQLKEISLELRRRCREEAGEQLADVRRRIELGRQRIREAEEDRRATKPLLKRLSHLEGQLINLERDYEVPIQIITALEETFMGLEHQVPPGSLLRIRLPGAVDVTVELDGVPF